MVIGLVSKSPEQAVAASQSCLFFSFPKGNSFGFFKETNILTLGQLLILNSLICYWPWRAWPGFTFDTHSSLFASTRHLFLPFSSKNGKSSCSNVSTWASCRSLHLHLQPLKMSYVNRRASLHRSHFSCHSHLRLRSTIFTMKSKFFLETETFKKSSWWSSRTREQSAEIIKSMRSEISRKMAKWKKYIAGNSNRKKRAETEWPCN